MNSQLCLQSVEETLAGAGWQEVEEGIWSGPNALHEPSGAEILATLLDQPPWLEPRLLYDTAGSLLFEQISRLPEYYLTRTELEILESSANTIIGRADSELLVELGAGFSVKTKTLVAAHLRHSQSTIFVPIDVSLTALRSSRDHFRREFPGLRFVGLHGDSESGLRALGQHRKMVLFLGSSIGNLAGNDLLRFFGSLESNLLAGDLFLLGVDHAKSPERIEAAYNDADGVTEAFIRNVLNQLNRILAADFDAGDFDYRARYSHARSRVELELIARRSIRVHCRQPEAILDWPGGTPIRVEVSRKFDPQRLVQQLSCFGFTLLERFSDGRDWFSVALLERVRESSAP